MTIFIWWHLTDVNDCVLTWPTGKETPRMQNMTTLWLDQLKRNTNLLHLEHIVELQVSMMSNIWYTSHCCKFSLWDNKFVWHETAPHFHKSFNCIVYRHYSHIYCVQTTWTLHWSCILLHTIITALSKQFNVNRYKVITNTTVTLLYNHDIHIKSTHSCI